LFPPASQLGGRQDCSVDTRVDRTGRHVLCALGRVLRTRNRALHVRSHGHPMVETRRSPMSPPRSVLQKLVHKALSCRVFSLVGSQKRLGALLVRMGRTCSFLRLRAAHYARAGGDSRAERVGSSRRRCLTSGKLLDCSTRGVSRAQEAAGSELTVMFAEKWNGSLQGQPRITHSRRCAINPAPRSFVADALGAPGRCFPLPITVGMGGAVAGRPIRLCIVNRPRGRRA
jgi:hypothetical protein